MKKLSIELIKKSPKFWMCFLFCFGMFGVQSCKKDPPCNDPTNSKCENYNPCYGKETINTFFKVKPGTNGFPPDPDWCEVMPTDTFNASSVLFEIPDGNPDYCTYEWQIGDEPEPRYTKKFEVDFDDYLENGKWESNIPITLRIRTPLNNCLKNPSDTLVTVTRNLFFTRVRSHQTFESRDSITRYKGYFTNNPSKEVTLEFFYLTNINFRGVSDLLVGQKNFDLMTGLPDFDTIWWKTPCNDILGCGNFKQIIVKYQRQENCFPKATGRLTEYQIIRLSEKERIFKFEFLRPNQPNLKYEFIGKLMN